MTLSRLDKSFPIQWVVSDKKYGFSTSSLRSKLKCSILHIPFTRKFVPRWHKLECGSVVVARIDNVTFGSEMMHEFRERGFEL